MSRTVYFYEDFSSKDLDESVVGRKGMSLFRLKDADVPVPPFFVVSPTVFDDLIYNAFGDGIEKYLKQKNIPDPIDVEKLLFSTEFGAAIEEELFKAYAKLSGFNDAWVAVRSSVIYLPDNRILFSGVFATEVNVRGFNELLKAVKAVYASIFQDSVVYYARNHNIDLSKLKMSVVVQKMVQAEVSGVTYTKELITQDESKMSIEAVFGLGDVISNGEITPDRYVLDKKDLSFLEKKVSPQDWMRIRMLSTKGEGGVEKINISSSWSHQQKLEDRFLKEIAKICLLIEDSFGKSQNIEWVWESGKVWVIQNKFVYTPQVQKASEKKFSNVLLNPVLNIVKQKKEEEIKKATEEKICEDKVCEKEKVVKEEEKISDLDEKIAKLSGKFEEFAKKKDEQEKKKIEKLTEDIKEEKREITDNISKNLIKNNLKAKNFKFLASGIGVSHGNKIGQVVHVNSKNFKDLVVSKENILIVDEVFPGVENAIFLSGGVLMDLGGISSDISILCREFGIPAILGVKNLQKLISEGSFVKIDANSGAIYLYDASEILEKEEEVDYEIVTNEKLESKKEKKEEEKKSQPKTLKEDVCDLPEIPKTATDVYLTSKNITNVDKNILQNSSGLVFLDLEEFMLNEKRHPLAFVQDGQMAEYTNFLAKKVDSIVDMFSGAEIIISLGRYRSKDFAQLTKGKSFEKDEQTRGVMRYLQNPEFTEVALKIVSKARNVYRNKNISLALHSPFSAENMIAIKKKILSVGLRRNSTFKIYAIIENPSEVILVDEIVSSNIDGLILNTPVLAKQMQGLSPYDEKAVCNLQTESLFRTLETIQQKVRSTKATILGVTENNDALLKKYVELGVFGVVVDAEKFVDAKKIISEKETEIILSRAKF